MTARAEPPWLRPLALAMALRVAAMALVGRTPAWDGWYYARLAERLAQGLGYVERDAAGAWRATAFYPVGLPAAMAALLPITGDVGRAAWCVNLAATALALLATMRLARALGGEVTARRAGYALAAYPGLVLWSTAAMTETLSGALLVGALAVMASRARGRDAWAGAMIGLAGLVRAQSLVAVLMVALRPGDARRRAGALAVCALAAAAVVAPWTLRNCRVFARCVAVSTNGGANLLIGTIPAAQGGFVHRPPTPACDAGDDESLRDACVAREATGRLRAAPMAWAGLALQKVARTFAWEHDPVSYARGTVEERHPDVGTGALVALCTAAWWALAWGCARYATRAHPSSAPWIGHAVAGLAVTSVATHAVFLGADRYHLMLVPAMIPLAALGRRDAEPT